jgi:hypothetical protein
VNVAVVEETIRRHLTSLGYIFAVISVTLAGILASTFHAPASAWPSLVALLAVVTGSALIGPEFSTGTLQLIVSKPVRRPVYVVSRVTGVFVSVALAATAGALAEIITRAFLGGVLPWRRILIVWGCSLIVSLLAIAILTFLGSVTRAYFNVAIYIGLQAALSMAEVFVGMTRLRGRFLGDVLERFEVDQMLVSIDDAFFPSVPAVATSAWALRVTATALLFVALACLAFARREVPYGSD